MAKFTKPFYGVPDGEIYPVQYEKGDDIPPELLEAAKEAGAVGGKKGKGDLKDDHSDNLPPEGGDEEREGDTGEAVGGEKGKDELKDGHSDNPPPEAADGLPQ